MKKIFIIIFSILILLVFILGIKFFLNNGSTNIFENKENINILTEEEKINILNQVSTTTPIKNTLSDKQKESILNKTSTTTKVPEMTYEEKMKILNATQ